MGVDVDIADGTAMDMPILPRGALKAPPDGLDGAPFGISVFKAADGVAALEEVSVVAMPAEV
jgi:hypothetical protein